MPDMPTATTTRSEIMLEGLIDYAGLYPPANLDMQATVHNWSANYSSEDRWMLARLIIPVNRLDEFTQAAEQLVPKSDEEPWQLKKSNIEKMNTVLHLSLEQIAKISILLNPVIPQASKKVLDALHISETERNMSFVDGNNVIPNEIKIDKLDILFKRITK